MTPRGLLAAALAACVALSGLAAAPSQAAPSRAAPADEPVYSSGWVKAPREILPKVVPAEAVIRLNCTVNRERQLTPCTVVSQSAGGVRLSAPAVAVAAFLGRFEGLRVAGAVPGAQATVDVYFALEPGTEPQAFLAVRFGAGEPPKPPGPAPRLPPAPGGGPDVPEVLMPIERPSDETYDAVFPLKAQRDGVEGIVGLVCIIGPEGWLKDCQVTYDSPEGYGFGQAALQLAAGYRTPTTFHGEDLVGARYRFTIGMRPNRPSGKTT